MHKPGLTWALYCPSTIGAPAVGARPSTAKNATEPTLAGSPSTVTRPVTVPMFDLEQPIKTSQAVKNRSRLTGSSVRRPNCWMGLTAMGVVGTVHCAHGPPDIRIDIVRIKT